MSFEAHGDGVFTREADTTQRDCKTCDATTAHVCDVWKSDCGGFTDYRYTCTVCHAVHWVDGIDS